MIRAYRLHKNKPLGDEEVSRMSNDVANTLLVQDNYEVVTGGNPVSGIKIILHYTPKGVTVICYKGTITFTSGRDDAIDSAVRSVRSKVGARGVKLEEIK